MKKFLLVALAVLAGLSVSRPAHAFHHGFGHGYSRNAGFSFGTGYAGTCGAGLAGLGYGSGYGNVTIFSALPSYSLNYPAPILNAPVPTQAGTPLPVGDPAPITVVPTTPYSIRYFGASFGTPGYGYGVTGYGVNDVRFFGTGTRHFFANGTPTLRDAGLLRTAARELRRAARNAARKAGLPAPRPARRGRGR